VRHREAAERTLLTAVAAGASPAALADLLLAADTDRAFADAGHSLDFTNKAFECLDLIGWEHADAVLPALVGQMVAARGAEESTSWRQPVDLIALCAEVAADLPDLFSARLDVHGWADHAALAQALLGDDPKAIMAALKAAILAGADGTDLGRSLAYAAALRLARFGSANEHSDWETAHHVFTYANAVHRMLKRIATADWKRHSEAVRGVLHGAMALYLARYLNVPPARIPGDGGGSLDDLPADAEEIRMALLDAFDRQRQVDLAAPRRASSHAWSLGAGADRDTGAGVIARRRGFSCLPSAGRRRAAVRRVGQYRRGSAYPHRCRPLSRRPFADRTRRAANGRHRPAAHARR
jgi:hypothetical protein